MRIFAEEQHEYDLTPEGRETLKNELAHTDDDTLKDYGMKYVEVLELLDLPADNAQDIPREWLEEMVKAVFNAPHEACV